MSKKILVLLCILIENVFALGNTRFVDISNYPYHVAVETFGKHKCSGALIHESWILTVASCVSNIESSMVTIRVRTSILSAGGDELKVASIIVHRNFDNYVYNNDIALVKKGPRKSKLAVTAVPIVNQRTCSLVMPTYEPVSEKMVCAGSMCPEVETCQGDPGAPLMEGQTLIGVLSYGLGCKSMIHPGVYTRISSYLPWISTISGIRYT